MYRFAIIFCVLCFAISCKRPTSAIEENETPKEEKIIISSDIQARITADNPFENQPNEFCTVIRKLEVSQYAPNLSEEELDASPHPHKYCLLDVCLDGDEPSIHQINLGDDTEQIMSAYKVITIFPNADSAQNYASKYKIVDVVIEN